MTNSKKKAGAIISLDNIYIFHLSEQDEHSC